MTAARFQPCTFGELSLTQAKHGSAYPDRLPVKTNGHGRLHLDFKTNRAALLEEKALPLIWNLAFALLRWLQRPGAVWT